VGDPERFELPQGRLGEDGAVRIRIDDDDGEVGRGHGESAVGGESDRAGRIDHGEAVAEEIEMHQIEFGGAGALPRLGARVADAGAGVDAALAVDRAGGEEQGLGEAGLSRSARSNEGDRPGSYRSVGHACLLAFQGATRVEARQRSIPPAFHPLATNRKRGESPLPCREGERRGGRQRG
jgi:hypothetical protein